MLVTSDDPRWFRSLFLNKNNCDRFRYAVWEAIGPSDIYQWWLYYSDGGKNYFSPALYTEGWW